MAVYGYFCARDEDGNSIFDGLSLVIHEAGHLLMPSGSEDSWIEFVNVASGTAAEMLVPLGIAVYFYLKGSRFSSAVPVFWTGVNLFHSSFYIKDASVLELPLVSPGGGAEIHDWNYMLVKMSLLRSDQAIGNAVHFLGSLTVVLSVALALYFSIEEEEEAPAKPKT